MLYPAAIGINEEFTVPANVKTIAGGAFAGAGITKIILPEGFASIGGSAFYGAYALQSIEIPDSIESIGSFAFLECTKLTEIAIPDGTTLGTYLFRSCTALESAVASACTDRCEKLDARSERKSSSPSDVLRFINTAFAVGGTFARRSENLLPSSRSGRA